MRLTQGFGALLFVVTVMGVTADRLGAQELSAQAWELETKGEAGQARQLLQKAAESRPNDAVAVLAYAEFLDRHRDPDTRMEYRKLLLAAQHLHGAASERMIAARRLAILDLLAGDRAATSKDLEEFRAAGGTGFELAAAASADQPDKTGYIQIPGPLHSFARMAALSPELKPAELLPALARNVVTNGYQAANANEALEQTEYLKLVVRYLSQARELERLAGEKKVIQHRQPAIRPRPATCCACSATACAAAAARTWSLKP